MIFLLPNRARTARFFLVLAFYIGHRPVAALESLLIHF